MINYDMTEKDIKNRKEWIRNRMLNNAGTNTLTDNQHRALAILSTYRHQIHCGRKEFFKKSSGMREKFSNFLNVALPIMLRQAKLPPLELQSLLDYMPDDETAKSLGLEGEFYDLAVSTCEQEAERINSIIESYLAGIDKKYGTWYAPTGLTRDNGEAMRKIG